MEFMYQAIMYFLATPVFKNLRFVSIPAHVM